MSNIAIYEQPWHMDVYCIKCHNDTQVFPVVNILCKTTTTLYVALIGISILLWSSFSKKWMFTELKT